MYLDTEKYDQTVIFQPHCKPKCARSQAKISQYFANYSFKKLETSALHLKKSMCLGQSKKQGLAIL